MRKIMSSVRWTALPIIVGIVERRRRRKRIDALYCLLLPGLRMKMGDYAKAGWAPKMPWDTFEDDAQRWLRNWISDHLGDVRRPFQGAVQGYVTSNMEPPRAAE